jgi:hypothetical protein
MASKKYKISKLASVIHKTLKNEELNQLQKVYDGTPLWYKIQKILEPTLDHLQIPGPERNSFVTNAVQLLRETLRREEIERNAEIAKEAEVSAEMRGIETIAEKPGFSEETAIVPETKEETITEKEFEITPEMRKGAKEAARRDDLIEKAHQGEITKEEFKKFLR